MKKEGLPIEGLCVAAGIPSTEKAKEIIDGLRDAGIKHVSFKPGSSSLLAIPPSPLTLRTHRIGRRYPPSHQHRLVQPRLPDCPPMDRRTRRRPPQLRGLPRPNPLDLRLDPRARQHRPRRWFWLRRRRRHVPLPLRRVEREAVWRAEDAVRWLLVRVEGHGRARGAHERVGQAAHRRCPGC